jgi:hypothetical protein
MRRRTLVWHADQVSAEVTDDTDKSDNYGWVTKVTLGDDEFLLEWEHVKRLHFYLDCVLREYDDHYV